jgi:6-phospho-beta-glucosidase
MLPRIAILGGSSPFTAGLIDALADPAQRVPAAELVLQGRSREALDLLAAFAQNRLAPRGWRISTTTNQDEAIAGSQIIVHQIRYGGLSGRADDEQLAAEFGVLADETLGPAGLQAALRAADELRALAARIEGVAPRAWVLNLTNPLSVATALLAERIGAKCLGLCELPWFTVNEACELLGVPVDEVTWAYAGLNHRGFVYDLEHRETDLIAKLAQQPSDRMVGKIPPRCVADVGALPLKYFRLMLGEEVLHVGRAGALEDLRQEILGELAADPARTPPSLTKRYMAWYPMSLVPVMASILNDDGGRHVVNVSDGAIVREQVVSIGAGGWSSLEQSTVPPKAAEWIDRFAAHEQAVMTAVQDPRPETIAAAVQLDPLTPAERAEKIAARLAERWSRSESVR